MKSKYSDMKIMTCPQSDMKENCYLLYTLQNSAICHQFAQMFFFLKTCFSNIYLKDIVSSNL